MTNHIYHEIKKLNRFKYLKMAGILFLISITMIILGATLDAGLSFIPVLFITGFVLFFVEFGFLIAFAVKATKSENRVKEMIIDGFWQKRIETWTYEHSNSFSVTSKNMQDSRYLTHPMIPQYATEHFYYTLSDITRDLHLHALRYTHQVSTGKGTSQSIDFSGYLILTKLNISSDLYVRKWDLSEKMKGFFMVPKPETIDENTAINGPFDQEMKLLRKKLLSLGFKDVIFLEQNGFLTILCEEMKLIPKVTKQIDENDERHKKHLLKLVQVISSIDLT